MDDAIIEVLEQYHARIERENLSFPVAAPGGRNSVNFQSMLAIGPETGQFLNILVHSLTAPRILELGTSFGYSAIWLAEAARATGGHLTTIEIDPERSAHALDMSTQAGLSPLVDFRIGDAITLIDNTPGRFDFVFVNLRKDLYLPCLEAFHSRLAPGAVIVANNIVRPGGPELEAYVQAVRAKPGISSTLLPVGSGLEVSRYLP